MRSRLTRALVQYYTALRLSAGAAVAFLPFDVPVPRHPIVRAADTSGPGGFDRREVIVQSGQISVVTVPFEARKAPEQPQFRLN